MRVGTFRHMSYSELVADVGDNKVDSADFGSTDITVAMRGKGHDTVVVDRIPNVDERPLLDAMEKNHVTVTAHPEKASWLPILFGVLPFLALPLVLWFFARGAARSKPLTFGQTKAKVYDQSNDIHVTFADVAGVDEAKGELTEVVQFLKEPEKYRAIGARVPKGVLLVGAPGTGKTLLAKAVAGESGVPFFALSGSEFVEMFVGVGASRVRDLFEQAKTRAPCIIFIDELDAVGKTRAGASGFASNEEREQTLNQLLVEMDGFDSGTGLIIMAATNRPEILDRALLRAGRFDRQVVVDRPDVRGRQEILNVHAKKVQLGADVDLALIAQRTPGMVGADLANVVNEAALASVRRDGKQVQAEDFEEAIDRIQLGLKKEGRVMTEDDKRRVAYHEAGHALVALSVAQADPVHRVTIISRSVGSLGATLQLPTQERYLMTRRELRDRICVMLGGRSAEELFSGDISTGAQDDLERVTELVRQMICKFGMSDALGPLTFGGGDPTPFVPEPHPVGDETGRLIDFEMKAIVLAEHERARDILAARRPALEAVVKRLLVKETLSGAELKQIVESSGGSVERRAKNNGEGRPSLHG
jgi:cell division protease FtsH